ncbi:hypothetical protein ACFX2J_007082 [Malus domestica]
MNKSRLFHWLPSGLNMEVIVHKRVAEKQSDEDSERPSENPPLFFIHGSYHAAWCWTEHWFPFFPASGYDCYAVSLLGQEKRKEKDHVVGRIFQKAEKGR